MKIDLKDIPVYWFGGIKPGREKRITNMFKRTGITGIKSETIINSNSVIGCALSMKGAVSKALSTPNPCLVLEDDSETTANFRSTIIDVPDDADAIYLCLSKYGVAPDWKLRPRDAQALEKSFSYENLTGKNVVRLLNMVTLTAVLYISDAYKRNTVRLIESAINDKIHCDVPVSLALPKFKVYALRRPLFYQECPLSKKSTNFTI